MNVDVVILTDSSSEESIGMTRRTIHTIKENEPNHVFHIHLVESGVFSKHRYDDMVENYIHPSTTFNYNKFVNIGLVYVKHDWVLISNNDIGYENNWFTEIMNVYKERPDIESFSPKDPMLYMIYFSGYFIGTDSKYNESHRVTESVMGWSILIKKTALDKITPFDEQFDMYYQDNDYAEMLKVNSIKHALVRNSIAVHQGTMRVKDVLSDIKIKKIEQDERKFRTKWNIWT